MLSPATEAELADAVAGAAAAGTPLEIAGGGTRRAIGRPVQAGETLSTAELTGIELYEPGALTLIVRAGTPLAELEETLAAEGQRLPFEPVDHRALLGSEGAPTIGGVVACAVSGPRRIQAGACRDAMLGVRFVTGEGQAVRNGGRVMKNVTGYDLVKLLCGSHGTLGVLTEIAFKLQPRPEREITLVIEGLDAHRAREAMAAAICAPFDVTGAAHLPRADDAPARTVLRVEGMADQASIARRALPSASLRSARPSGSRVRRMMRSGARSARHGPSPGGRARSGASRCARPRGRRSSPRSARPSRSRRSMTGPAGSSGC